MSALLEDFGRVFGGIMKDVAPIFVVLLGFQLGILRRRIPHARRVMLGLLFVMIGLAFFLFGLELALFPLGKEMARQLTDPVFLGVSTEAGVRWTDYYWTYLFAFSIGFATTIAEPALIAVSLKAEDVSGGTVKSTGLRIAVAIGVALSLTVSTFRIVTGTPLFLYLIVGYVLVVIQTMFAPRSIIPLAYDSGGVSTSTVTVPLVAALGLGLATNVPGRSAVMDGFGLIALACLFPMITVMGYAQISGWLNRRQEKRSSPHSEGDP